jgi:hypothetical protein
MMNIETVNEPRKNTAEPKIKANFAHLAPGDRFVEARAAKKKEKRARHHARLRRSNTGG